MMDIKEEIKRIISNHEYNWHKVGSKFTLFMLRDETTNQILSIPEIKKGLELYEAYENPEFLDS